MNTDRGEKLKLRKLIRTGVHMPPAVGLRYGRGLIIVKELKTKDY